MERVADAVRIDNDALVQLAFAIQQQAVASVHRHSDEPFAGGRLTRPVGEGEIEEAICQIVRRIDFTIGKLREECYFSKLE